MRELTDKDFDIAIEHNDVVLVDVWAEWCGSCKALMPILEQIEKEMLGKVKIFKLDLEKSSTIASRYSIKSLPTLLYFKKGVLTFVGGATDKIVIQKHILGLQ